MDRSLGNYELHEPLGRGASGEVWRGTSRPDGAAVAVKVLRPELADDRDAVARLLRERDVLTGIESPHLVPVRDVVVEGDTVAVVMDLATGVDLRRLLRASPTQPPGLACAIAAQVAEGLAAVHAAGVVHRDVKPENVLVDLSVPEAPVARLTDFGVAGLVAEAGASRATGVVGTPEYLAPELAEGSAATPAVDVYSLGILLYELCCGRTPFAGGHPMAVLRRQLEDPPLRPPGLSAPLWGLLSWMLDKSPASRPSADDVAGALEDLAEALARRPALEPLPPFEDEGPEAPVPAAPPVALPPARPLRPFRPGARRRRRSGPHHHARPRSGRAVLFAAPLLVALVAAALVGIEGLERRPAGTYRFAPFTLDNGLAVERTWRFGDEQGGTLVGSAEVHNRTDRPFTGTFDEVLPASMVRDPAAVRREPAGESPPNPAGDPVLRFALNDLDPGYFWRISYQVEVPPDGTGRGRLERWADDQRVAFERWGRTPAGREQGVPNVLVSFDVEAPDDLTLPVGASYQLPLVGRMSDGTRAPRAVLALVRWSSDDPAVATVHRGLVEARTEGTTELRAVTDELEEWSGGVEVVARGAADVPDSDFALPGTPRLAPNAPPVRDVTRTGDGTDTGDAVACANSDDDDGDGLVDLADPGCADASDDDEGSVPPVACANAVDDDGDGAVDVADPGCTSADDDDETNRAAACGNGVDDDGDGAVDAADVGCASDDDDDETDPPACANGLDDDGDGLTDVADPGCESPADVDETNPVAGACANGVDDDGDGAVDLDDPGCTSSVDLDESGVGGSGACANGVDDDGDGLTDLDDRGCESAFDPEEADRATTSSTGPSVPASGSRGLAGTPGAGPSG